MSRAQGARSQLAAAFETTYGTAPTSGFMQMPFASAVNRHAKLTPVLG